MQDGHPTAPVYEDTSFSLNLVIDAEVVLVIINHHITLADAVVIAHFEVELRIAVHDTTFFHHTFERTNVVNGKLESKGAK